MGPTVVLAAFGGNAKTEAGLGLLVVPAGAAAFAMSGEGPDACLNGFCGRVYYSYPVINNKYVNKSVDNITVASLILNQ